MSFLIYWSLSFCMGCLQPPISTYIISLVFVYPVVLSIHPSCHLSSSVPSSVPSSIPMMATSASFSLALNTVTASMYPSLAIILRSCVSLNSQSGILLLVKTIATRRKSSKHFPLSLLLLLLSVQQQDCRYIFLTSKDARRNEFHWR